MPHNETFDFAGPAGPLEAILMHPESAPRAVAVVCHAHPLHGGMMHFKVVFRAAKALQHAGIAALRFNFRGVGRSAGVHDQGRGEQDDVRAALDYVQQRFPALPSVLGGFSFGSSMAVHVGCTDTRVRALFLLGLPIVRMTTGLALLDGCRKPRLFVQGERDEFGSGDDVRALVQRLPPPSTLRVVEQADHFFSGHLDALQEAVQAWAATDAVAGGVRREGLGPA